MKIIFCILTVVLPILAQTSPGFLASSAVVGSSIASASTIAPVAAITPISGTATITTITPPIGFSTSGAGGCLFLIATGAWTMNAVSIPFTAVTGTFYELCYSAATATWYTPPSGSGAAVSCDPNVPGSLCVLGYATLSITNVPGLTQSTSSSGTFTVNNATSVYPMGSTTINTGTTNNSAPSLALNLGTSGGNEFIDPLGTTGTYESVVTAQMTTSGNTWLFVGLSNNCAAGKTSPSNSDFTFCEGIEYDTSQSDTSFMCSGKLPFNAGVRSAIAAIDTSPHIFTFAKVGSSSGATQFVCTMDGAHSTTITLPSGGSTTATASYAIGMQTLTTTNKVLIVGGTVRVWRTGMVTF